MAEPLFLECVDCGNKQSFVALKPTVCESCGGAWVEAHYDYLFFGDISMSSRLIKRKVRI